MTILEQLAENIAAVRFEDLPAAAVRWAKAAVLDTVGVTLAGAAEDCARIVAGVLGSSDEGGPAMVEGASFRTPGNTIACSSSSRGITCRDLAGSGESFTIGDNYVNVNGVETRN